MTHDGVQLHRQGAERFSQAENGRKLVLIHTAVALGSSLLLAVINYLFSLQIAETGGLSGMGLRTILSTAQTFLEMTVMLALPFWEIGIVYVGLRWVRGERADEACLLQGFRRLGPVLGFRILYAIILAMLGIGIFNVAYMIFFMSPLSADMAEHMKPMMELMMDPSATAEQVQALVTPEMTEAMMKRMIPMLAIFGILFLPVLAVVFYRLRFAEFFVMDGVRAGSALTASLYITRKQFWQLVKLDLHFWWYYLLQILCVAACFADAIAELLGIMLPVSGVAAYFIAYIVGTLLQGVLLWRCRGQVLCTYCLAFEDLTGRNAAESV